MKVKVSLFKAGEIGVWRRAGKPQVIKVNGEIEKTGDVFEWGR